MMRFLTGALLVAALTSEAHAQLPKGVTSETDKFLKKEFQSTGIAALDAPSMFDGKITIGFSRVVNEPPAPSILYMNVAYRHSEWAFIEGGYSLMVKADTLVFDLRAAGSPRRDVERGIGKVDEYVNYLINPCRVLQMQSAKTVVEGRQKDRRYVRRVGRSRHVALGRMRLHSPRMIERTGVPVIVCFPAQE
jgi:hypothetical protein